MSTHTFDVADKDVAAFKALVKAGDGRILCSSIVTRGYIFTVALPTATPVRTPVRTACFTNG